MASGVYMTSKKSKKKAFWLCVFGGWFGLHYFYVGRWGRAFFSMLTINLFMFGWWFDVWKIARGRFKDQYGDYLKE